MGLETHRSLPHMHQLIQLLRHHRSASQLAVLPPGGCCWYKHDPAASSADAQPGKLQCTFLAENPKP